MGCFYNPSRLGAISRLKAGQRGRRGRSPTAQAACPARGKRLRCIPGSRISVGERASGLTPRKDDGGFELQHRPDADCRGYDTHQYNHPAAEQRREPYHAEGEIGSLRHKLTNGRAQAKSNPGS